MLVDLTFRRGVRGITQIAPMQPSDPDDLVTVTMKRAARSVTEISPPTLIGPYALLTGTIIRAQRPPAFIEAIAAAGEYALLTGTMVRHPRTALIETIASSGGGTISFIVDETPTGAINGSNKDFNTSQPFTASNLWIYLNGLRQRRLNDFVITTQQSFHLVIAPLAGDTISVDYLT